MTPPDLQALAADCEARAAHGEKPVHPDWAPSFERPFFNCHSCLCLLDMSVCESRDKRGERPPRWLAAKSRDWSNAEEFTSLAAGQLFAESLLRRATLALHPPSARAAHVEAAVGFAAKVLDIWASGERPIVVGKLGTYCGLIEGDGNFGNDFTDLGRQLLADAAALARPTDAPDAKPE